MTQATDRIVSYTAGETLAQYRRVKDSGDGRTVNYADAGEAGIGTVETTTASGDEVAIRLDTGSQTIKCVAAGAIAAGANVYGAADGKVNDVADGLGVIGTSRDTSTADGDVIEVLLKRAVLSDVVLSGIHVSKAGNDALADGSIFHPYLTVTAALAAAAAASVLNIFVWPGTYTEAAEVVWPTTLSGIHLIGMGHPEEVVIATVTGETSVIDCSPGVQLSTFEIYLENLLLNPEAGQNGLHLDNTSMTKKLISYGTDVAIHQSGGSGNAIEVTHGDTGNAVRIYWDSGNRTVLEGTVNFAVNNDGDKIHFTGYHLEGGITTDTQATVMEIICRYCKIMDAGIIGGASQHTFLSIFCTGEDGALFAAGDVADQTETIVGS